MAQLVRTHDHYTVAWICPLEIERVAATQMLDEQHARLSQHANDSNSYTLGSIEGHNIVLASLSSAGNCPAATVITHMRNTFKKLRFALLVGIGGGVPISTKSGPIRLGHVIVSQSEGRNPGVIQYDHGKSEANNVFYRTGALAPPPAVLLNAAVTLSVERRTADPDPLLVNLKRIDTTKRTLKEFRSPGRTKDRLYRSDYVHRDKKLSCQKCGCDPAMIVDRKQSDSDEESDDEDDDNDDDYIVVHRGTIASGEGVMRDGERRDALAAEHGILCFEMEAAGVLVDFPCLVIRGVSDYSDSHKNDKWHGYAAATAAAYARELFKFMPIDQIEQCSIAASDVKQMRDDTHQIYRHAQDLEVMAWLKPPDTSSDFNDACDAREEGTGKWFLTAEPYTNWKEAGKGVIWLRGIPGCGKTVLSSSVILDLRKIPKPAMTLFFFFSFRDNRRQGLSNMLRSLIFQVYQHNGEERAIVEKAFKNDPTEPSLQQLKDILHDCETSNPGTKIVLDALDECQEREELLTWITQSSKEDMAILCTSQLAPDIEKVFLRLNRSNRSKIVDFEEADVDGDIRVVIRQALEHDMALSRFKVRPGVSDSIEEKLMAKSKGMFRWAVCQLNAIRRCYTERDLKKALDNLPEGLNETYHRILSSISAQDQPYAIRLLQVLTYATRPLHLEEAVDFVALSLDSIPAFSIDARSLDPREITRYCSSLISINERMMTASERDIVDLSVDRSTKLFELQLAHLSVQEYFLSEHIEASFAAFFEEMTARTSILQASLGYLFSAANDPSHGNILMNYPYLKFFVHYWRMKCLEPVDTTVDDQLFSFFSTSAYWGFWLTVPGSDFDSEDFNQQAKHPNANQSPVYWAAAWLMPRLVHRLADCNFDVNVQGGPDWTALQSVMTCRSRKFARANEIAAILLKHGAQIDVRDTRDIFNPRFWDDALSAASHAGNADGVRLLLNYAAGLKPPLESLSRALQASFQGMYNETNNLFSLDFELERNTLSHEDHDHHYRPRTPNFSHHSCAKTTVQDLLTDNATEVNEAAPATLENVEGRYRIKNMSGAFKSKDLYHIDAAIDIIQQLLDGGAEVADGRVRYDNGGWVTLLQFGTTLNNDGLALMLLKHGADVSKPGTISADVQLWPLVQAVIKRHTATVRLLLDLGADPNVCKVIPQGGHRKTALNEAALAGDVDLSKMLLEKGADPNLPDAKGQRPLHRAARSGHEDVIRILLENGAAIKESDTRGNTALSLSAWKGHENIVRTLLANGAAVNHSNADGKTALMLSAQGGHESIVRILLENGAAVNDSDTAGQTALYSSAWKGHEHVVRILLKNGAAVDDCDINGDTSLIAAAEEGHEGVVRTLLDNKATTEKEGLEEGSAITAAASNGHLEIVQMLLESGAETTSSNPLVGPLYQASHNGQAACVRLLLEHHAEIFAHAIGWHSLMAASANGHLEVVELLLSFGVDPNIGRPSASSQPFIRSPLALRANDALFDERDGPLLRAVRSGEHQIARLLSDKVHSIDQLEEAAVEAYIEGQLFPLLKDKLVERLSNGRDALGRTLLHRLCFSGLFSDVLALLESGQGIHDVDNCGWTALHWAAYGTRMIPWCIEELLRHGIDHSRRDNHGWTAAALRAVVGDTSVNSFLTLGEPKSVLHRPFVTPIHHTICRSCSKMPIRGILYHCKRCPSPPGGFVTRGYDLCFRCIEDVDNFHPGHAFTTAFRYPNKDQQTLPEEGQLVWQPRSKPLVKHESNDLDIRAVRQLSDRHYSVPSIAQSPGQLDLDSSDDDRPDDIDPVTLRGVRNLPDHAAAGSSSGDETRQDALVLYGQRRGSSPRRYSDSTDSHDSDM